MTKINLQPTGDQVRSFRDRKTGEPIVMLNLLKFKQHAVYEDGRASDLSGEQAYKLYGTAFDRIVGPQGAKVLYSGDVRGFLIGEGEGAWEAMVLVQYPSTDVMLGMWRNEEYQQAQLHRAAGLEGQLLVECGAGFSFT
ncbi:MAG: hypothetical protein ACI9W1_000029 [Candidatus Azotimanducaceae bacterium]|jgi:uncharacterized protein (DUF1330 family)